ncbi:GPP34 family phosphoprotein [Streptomyces sp. NPDC050842]|uniref:GOLPH3/VPS74 family protein n=1 Tax=Streptomyces sp. NPDC050842 TaxID=3365636 RepID=UPI0037950442
MAGPTRHRSLAAELVLAASGGPLRSSWRQTELGFATVGAALHELARAGRIAVSPDAVFARGAERCPDPVADLLLEHLLLAERALGPREWIERLGPELLDLTRAELISQGLLVQVRRRVLGLFPVREFLGTGAPDAVPRDEVVAALLRAIQPRGPAHGPPGPAPAPDPITDAVASATSAAWFVLAFPG